MPLVVITDPQLASYIGIPVGGLAIDQRAEGGGIVGFHGTPSPADPTHYTEADLAAIITALPSLPSLRTKFDVLLALMHAHGAVGRWDGRGLHPRFGFLWIGYLVSEALGDALALIWPQETLGQVYESGVYEVGVYE